MPYPPRQEILLLSCGFRSNLPLSFIAQHTDLVLQALQLMFLRRRVMSLETVAAFVKRLATVAVSLMPHQAIGMLAVVRAITDKYPRAQQLLDNEPTPTGIFRPEIDDPAHANAFATSCWELTLLRSSYHPFASRLTAVVLAGAELPAQVARVSPNALVESFDCSAGGFMPPVQAPPKQQAPSFRVYKSLDAHRASPFVARLQEQSAAATSSSSSSSSSSTSSLSAAAASKSGATPLVVAGSLLKFASQLKAPTAAGSSSSSSSSSAYSALAAAALQDFSLARVQAAHTRAAKGFELARLRGFTEAAVIADVTADEAENDEADAEDDE